MVDTTIITAAGIVAAIIAAAAYSHYTGNEASVDTDGDGDDELTFGSSDEAADSSATESAVKSESVGSDEVPDELTDITGVGPTKAGALEDTGLETPKDVYYASDENVTDATGIGSGVLGQIRDDIGGIDHNDSGNEDE